MQTRVTRLFKIQHPIVLPGMSWISKPKLVAAVCNAGGLGILASGPLSAVETAAAIKEIRSLTDKPFGIGTTLMMPVSVHSFSLSLLPFGLSPRPLLAPLLQLFLPDDPLLVSP
jgi:enoyl-[acyl-carrier protein] reductase II